jgi:hypothetical protein
MEMAGVPLRLRFTDEKGEVTFVDRHQAIETMRRPQETKTGKFQLSSMTLRIVTGMHLMLGGEGFWIFNKRLKCQYGGAPTYIDLSLPQSIEKSSTATMRFPAISMGKRSTWIRWMSSISNSPIPRTGEHFPPREVVELMARLILLPVATELTSGPTCCMTGSQHRRHADGS